VFVPLVVVAVAAAGAAAGCATGVIPAGAAGRDGAGARSSRWRWSGIP
jgi:hypothetical protein